MCRPWDSGQRKDDDITRFPTPDFIFPVKGEKEKILFFLSIPAGKRSRWRVTRKEEEEEDGIAGEEKETGRKWGRGFGVSLSLSPAAGEIVCRGR